MRKTIFLAMIWLAFFQGKPPVRTIQILPSSEDSSCSLPKPSNIHSTLTSSSVVNFEWDAVPGAAYYRVKVFKASSNALLYTRLVTASPNKNGVVIDNLPSAGLLNLEVYSVCSNGVESPKPN